MKALIFNIQKFSIHDGPGIRTTVFFKGCPLRCKWCSNPESQSINIEVIHDPGKCSQCLTCLNYNSDLKTNGKDILIPVKLDNLDFVKKCPNKAFNVEGEYKDIEEIVKICLQDLPFYEESGGGITFSGGEGMVQPKALEELIKRFKEKNIHTAIETTGEVNHEIFKNLASKIDLILFDVKHYDSKKHKEGTGTGNELILNNLKWLSGTQIDHLIRIPVIPNFNDSLEDANNFAKLFNDLGVVNVQLLPFHQFGEKKYENLKRNYDYKGIKAYHPEDLKEFQTILQNSGINCFI